MHNPTRPFANEDSALVLRRMKPIRLFFGIIKVPLDFLLTVAAFYVALKLRTIPGILPSIQTPFDLTVLPDSMAFFYFTIKSAALLVAIFAIDQMYIMKVYRALSRELAKLFFVIFSWMMIIIAYYFVIRTFPFSRLVLIYATILTTLFLATHRIIIHYIRQALFRRGIGQYRVAIIGDGTFAKDFTKKIQKHLDYKFIGYILEKERHHDEKYLGTLEDLEKIIQKHQIEQIIQTSEMSGKGPKILALCRQHHIKYSFVPSLLEVQKTNIEISTVRGIPVIELKPTPLDSWGKILKRMCDILGSIIGLIIATPIIILAAIAIKLDSQGPVFFTKLDDGRPVLRVGQHGKTFKFYKLRTMYPNTHHLRYDKLADQNIRKDSPLVKIKNDPRITRVGKFLRRFSIDELPQLWNVLIGNMSLVGPRPHFPEEVARYAASEKFVLEVKPGLTGISQTSGRSDLDFKEEIHLDTYYIQNWSLDLDLKIIAKTLFIVMRGYKE